MSTEAFYDDAEMTIPTKEKNSERARHEASIQKPSSKKILLYWK